MSLLSSILSNLLDTSERVHRTDSYLGWDLLAFVRICSLCIPQESWYKTGSTVLGFHRQCENTSLENSHITAPSQYVVFPLDLAEHELVYSLLCSAPGMNICQICELKQVKHFTLKTAQVIEVLRFYLFIFGLGATIKWCYVIMGCQRLSSGFPHAKAFSSVPDPSPDHVI